MTLQEVLQNEELRQHEFPITRKTAFFGHAGVCPLPRRVVEAMNGYNEQCSERDQESSLPAQFFTTIREKAARLMGAAPEEIAFIGPTSGALSLVANGLKFRKSDHVL